MLQRRRARVVRSWRSRTAMVVLLPAMLVAGAAGYTVGNSIAASSVGAGTGRVTVTVTPQGQVSMHTAPFSAP